MANKHKLSVGDIKEAQHRGMTISDLAKENGVTYQTAWSAVSRSGIKLKRPAPSHDTRYQVMRELMSAALSGASIKQVEIAKRVGVSKQRVSRIIKDLKADGVDL